MVTLRVIKMKRTSRQGYENWWLVVSVPSTVATAVKDSQARIGGSVILSAAPGGRSARNKKRNGTHS